MSVCRARSEGDPILEKYHDHEWCKINHDDIRKDERGHEEKGHRLCRPGDYIFISAGHRDRERPFGRLRIQMRWEYVHQGNRS